MPAPFGQGSLIKLVGVHADMQQLAKDVLAASSTPFIVVQGLRTREQQYRLWRDCHNLDGTRNSEPWKTNANGTAIGEVTPEGAAGTGLSNHQSGLAIDIAATPTGGVISWDSKYYRMIANVFLAVGAKTDVPVLWGGSFKGAEVSGDLGHFSLNPRFYT